MADIWITEEQYWRNNYTTRPYATGRSFDQLSGAYRYGVESANRHTGREWNDVEPDLRRGWDAYQYRGQNTWENIKDAVRDAWDRITGRQTRT